MMMTPDVIEKKWRCHDDLAITANNADPCTIPAVPTQEAIPEEGG